MRRLASVGKKLVMEGKEHLCAVWQVGMYVRGCGPRTAVPPAEWICVVPRNELADRGSLIVSSDDEQRRGARSTKGVGKLSVVDEQEKSRLSTSARGLKDRAG